jgi:Ca-activated chloride channel family protein
MTINTEETNMHPSLHTLTCALMVGLSACASDGPERDGENVTTWRPAPHPSAEVLSEPGRKPMSGVLSEQAVKWRMDKSIRYDKAESSFAAAAGAAPAAPMVNVMQTLPGVITNRDKFAEINDNGVQRVAEQPLSTFSIDVDTGAYSVIRRYLNQGQLPPSDAVRIEEMINYFDYAYAVPAAKGEAFSVHTEIAPTPWNEHSHLVQIGIQGYQPDAGQRADANLVFLIDVSGSMNAPDKLPLLKNALRLLVKQLNNNDRVTMVVYAGSSGVVLETTAGDRHGDILAALDRLSAGGSTHGSAGIQLAYDMARQAFIEKGVNRVILATDGDFNVGTVNHDALVDIIERNKNEGIALTTLGFGSGNYNDHLMEQLADHGDGAYAYIDSLKEARKVLVEQINGTLETIASDVKIQVEWNPEVVAEYRLIGYENRLLRREDFNNDRVDAGDIGAGHNVTALYEITLTHSQHKRIDDLRYATPKPAPAGDSNELAFVKLRYKKPGTSASTLLQRALLKSDIKPNHASSSEHLRFATAVAAFGEQLRGGEHLVGFGYPDIVRLARAAKGEDRHGYRGEFVGLVELAATLDGRG